MGDGILKIPWFQRSGKLRCLHWACVQQSKNILEGLGSIVLNSDGGKITCLGLSELEFQAFSALEKTNRLDSSVERENIILGDPDVNITLTFLIAVLSLSSFTISFSLVGASSNLLPGNKICIRVFTIYRVGILPTISSGYVDIKKSIGDVLYCIRKNTIKKYQ